MVRLKTIKPEIIDLWRETDDSPEYIGSVNIAELAHARLQIKQQTLEGYFIHYKGINYPINNKGMFNTWPKGLDKEYLDIINELVL